MNKRHVISLIIAGIVMTLPVNSCFAQTDEPKENDIRQMQILLRTEGLDVVSPERQGGVPALMKDQMLPPEYKTQKEKSDIRLQRLRDAKEKAKSKQNNDTSFFREQLSQQIEFLANQGTDVQKLKEIVERLELSLEKSEKEPTDDIAVAVFAVPGEPQQRPEGSPKPTPPTPPLGERPIGDRPGFKPPMLMMQGHMLRHNEPSPQIHRLQMHQPEGPFAEDLKRITALNESAERLAHAGMPDIAHGLRERAGQIKKELAEKQERIQHEERERAQAKMREQQERMAEQRRDAADRVDHPALPLRELQEQLEHLRREVHSINEKVSHLTEMIEHHHRAQERREHHEEMDDDDDHEDDDTDDDDRKARQDRDIDKVDDDDREDD